MDVAILGATGNVGRTLVNAARKHNGVGISAYVRNINKARMIINQSPGTKLNIYHVDDFGKRQHDAVINSVGVSAPDKIKNMDDDLFCVSEYYDNRIIEYIKNNNSSIYINFSSGAVFGKNSNSTVSDDTDACYPVNNIGKKYAYGMIKTYMETKHRFLNNLNIIDIRIFSFFSQYVDIDSKLFLNQATKCILEDTVFQTNKSDMVRDYIHADDLFSLLMSCIMSEKCNTAIDIYSAGSISKWEILEILSREYGLRYKISESLELFDATGSKSEYRSSSLKAEKLFGYKPTYSSMETIRSALNEIIEYNKN